VEEQDATYMAPCEPTKIICIHLNYESRRVEFKAPALITPIYFQKANTALNSHRGVLHRPDNCQYLNYEGEIAAIIGKPMKNVARDDVWDHIAGFAPANDVGCQDFRDTDAGSMLRVKGMDGFCPIGPGLVSGVDIRESRVQTFIDGEEVQNGPQKPSVGWHSGSFRIAENRRAIKGHILVTIWRVHGIWYCRCNSD
jgi:5-oxopent-3-ene-1,2,5-tricarboxylate decarboxylase/2-hydroxyhepta-2,4-diene-1,7-dioate isomerase